MKLRIALTATPLRWSGGGSGTVGFRWEEPDSTGFPVVPVTVDRRLAGGNKGVKSLLEAKDFPRYRWDQLTSLGPEGKKGEGTQRQKDFLEVVVGLASVDKEFRVPYVFLDATEHPFRLDKSCIEMAVNAGILKDEVVPRHGEPLEFVTLVDAFVEDNRRLLEKRKAVLLGREPGGGGGDHPYKLLASPPDPIEGIDLAAIPTGDLRQAIAAARVGQGLFKAGVVSAYCGRCAVSGNGVTAALEAAHIIPNSVAHTLAMDPRNGILLRADLHALFDVHLLGFRPDAAGGPPTVVVADALRETEYGVFHERQLALPAHTGMWPSRIAVSRRWSISGLGVAVPTTRHEPR